MKFQAAIRWGRPQKPHQVVWTLVARESPLVYLSKEVTKPSSLKQYIESLEENMVSFLISSRNQS
jgi:hypothetical protein